MAITGVIRPPPDIRVVADRTASYVAKNGRAFEARILKSEKGKTPKFAFLHPTSPFHAYYEDRIDFYENGGDDDEEEKPAKKNEGGEMPTGSTSKGDAVRKKEKKQKASAVDPIARALLLQRARITQGKSEHSEQPEQVADVSAKESTMLSSVPPPLPLELVAIVAPADLSATQIETIQLVAHLTALDGKGGSFLHQLTVREWNNSEFSFCQPRHAHFAYFSALVDAYRNIFGDWTLPASSSVLAGLHSVPRVLDEAAFRAEYAREIDEQMLDQEEGAVVAIDWHDFIVVETIDFPIDEAVELSMLPPPPPPPMTTQPEILGSHPSTVEQNYGEEENETIRVVPSYTPKVVVPSRPQEARAIDPITGKSVSVADMPEHLRIQLLDPKWAEERRKFQEKQRDSNLVGDDAIATNISRFARGDNSEKSDHDLVVAGKDSKRRLEEAKSIVGEVAYQAPVGKNRLLPTAVNPKLPPMEGGRDGTGEPSPKRLRLETNRVPPPPPPDDSQQNETAVVAAAETLVDGSTNAPLPNGTIEFDSTEVKLLSESEFAASLTKPDVTVQIRIPNDPSQMAWNFYGQILSMTVNVMSKVKDVKAELSRTHLNGMPSNKIQFKDAQIGFLKDSMTLASLNIGPTATVELIPKTRGGRK